MIFFRRLALHRFVNAHPPAQQVSPASEALIAAYEGMLPAGLIELWRRKGLGFYGDLQLALIDPQAWQSVLDRWVVAAPRPVQRIPIALTPFGILLYYRKLTATDEDVSYIDPVSKKSGVLALSLDDFFNRIACGNDTLETIVSPSLAHSARRQCGPLAAGEVYEIDETLLAAQTLSAKKVDALEMHRRLRDAVDAATAPATANARKPATVADAIPDEYRSLFDRIETGNGLALLYLSSYLDSHRLLALQADGHYQLLFWEIDDRTFDRTDARAYTGSYRIARNAEGDETVELRIALHNDSLGSDANDAELTVMRTEGTTFLLRTTELESVATAIGGWNEMGRSDDYFRSVTLSDAFVEEPFEGRAAPPFADLPRALQALVHVEPLRATITHIAPLNPDQDDEEEGTVMCTLSLGEDDGLRMNMPLFSPAETGRQLVGWVWEMAPRACKAGIEYRKSANGAIVHGPVVGDVLITRAPE